ncbi:DUF5908 family protein [Aquimarina rubra]|uniref:DUF5908 family protein n=1 Tax=Aquimarina rubra TaxID=1920033 RepID=A0ABW5LH50_9FLAO
MPVEIKELVIRAVVEQHQNTSSEHHTHNDRVVQECVSQVLKILKKKNRR